MLFTDPTSFVFAVCLIVITIVIAVVGIYAVLVMADLRKTLQKTNATIDLVDEQIVTVSVPIKRMSDITTYLTSGMKVFEAVSAIMAKRSAANAAQEADEESDKK